MTLLIGVTDDLETCLHLRRVVFMDEQNVPEADERDGRDGDAVHLLARKDGIAVGCARILRMGDTGKIGRVCVLPGWRGTGLGRALILACLDVLRAEGMARAKLGAQVHALGFYERLGFVAEGPVYDDAGIAHRDMVRDLRA
ncbi:acetyltransferase, GNAT family protein [Oceaniovalibus guishaninsula JLT2003]|uniref:Acetyltransferase, GNAT family protein n=1 Tax=Oceaniovalibus guishaninsula JLT2003 TaxID=1231392 RepID=K2HBY0_9RHOB|nr:GNAT family N-acetyltransferase [Oceaniovalibus guishaninsula]EKE44998.1 acetyltransferase, GNAT family protein [Oceaniovalibus guishaninsula JLT2003]